MSFRLREFDFSDADYETIARINQAVWPETRRTAAEFKRIDEKSPVEKYDWIRIVAEWDEKPVGFGVHVKALWHDAPNQYSVGFVVLPEYRNRGIASTYFEKVMNEFLVDRDVSSLIAGTQSSQPEAISFLENRGFELQLRRVWSELILNEVDFEHYRSLQQKTARSGIKIQPLSELMPIDTDYQHKLNELDWVLLNDEPHSEPPKRKTVEEFAAAYINTPRFFPEGWFVATVGDKYVGWCAVLPNLERKDGMWQGITVIDRNYRRRGLATVMKLKTFALAKSLGAKVLETTNAEGNPMLDLNMKLGFRPKVANLEYKRPWNLNDSREQQHENQKI